MLDRLPDCRRIAQHDYLIEKTARDAVRRSFELLAETEAMVHWSRQWRETAQVAPPEPDGPAAVVPASVE